MSVFDLKGKTILIISPDKWSNLRVSKHHYALELKSRGNRVIFLEPPTIDGPKVPVLERNSIDDIEIIRFNSFVKGERFLPLCILNIIRKRQALLIRKVIGSEIDVVWAFYVSQFFDLSVFKPKLKIFHPVDKILSQRYWVAAEDADVVLSVADFLLEDFKSLNKHCYIINHGISPEYVAIAKQAPVVESNNQMKFGYVGNLLRYDMDHPIILKIVKENPEVNFLFWGNYQHSSSTPQPVVEFISDLIALPNVSMLGLRHPSEIAAKTIDLDGFLCCYNPKVEVNRASNNHKLLEYLSTGKVVVSHRVEMYDDKRYLLEMCSNYSNDELPSLFRNVVNNIDLFNSKTKQQIRKDFALDNSYTKQVDRIENILMAL